MSILHKSQRLKKELGFLNIYAIATGATMSSGFFLLPGLAFVEAGPAMMLSYIIAAAMMINLIVAAFAGAYLPLFLKRIDIDPALAGSVALTTVTDSVGFFVFLGLANVFYL